MSMNRWYKDRDFPEVKAANDDIVAVVLDPKQLQRVIDEHNKLLDDLDFYMFHNRNFNEQWPIQKAKLDAALARIAELEKK